MRRLRWWQVVAGAALLLAGTGTGRVGAQAALTGPDVVVQGAMHLSVPAGDASIVSVVLDFAPGAGVPEHVHGGPLVVNVLSGAIDLTEDGATKTYKVGQSWTEMPGHKHTAVNAGSTPARVAVTALLPKGAELQTLTGQGANPPGLTAPTVTYQAAYPLSPTAEEADLVGLVLNFPPGAGIPNHVHGGPLIAQVLSGAITLTEDGGSETYAVGKSWTETPGHVHNARNEGSTSASVLVSALIPKGAELQTIVAGQGSVPAGMPTTGGGAGWPWLFTLAALSAILIGIPLRRRTAAGRTH